MPTYGYKPMREQICASRSFDLDEQKSRRKTLSLEKSGIDDPELCMCVLLYIPPPAACNNEKNGPRWDSLSYSNRFCPKHCRAYGVGGGRGRKKLKKICNENIIVSTVKQ